MRYYHAAVSSGRLTQAIGNPKPGRPHERMLVSSGSTFEREIGFSRAVVQGDWVFVSGTTGFDYSIMTIAEGIQEQTEQRLKNIESALLEARKRRELLCLGTRTSISISTRNLSGG